MSFLVEENTYIVNFLVCSENPDNIIAAKTWNSRMDILIENRLIHPVEFPKCLDRKQVFKRDYN